MTISSTPVSRRCLLATIFGSKLESRSRGTEISTGPVSVSTVLARRAVAGIAAVAAFRVMLAIAEMVVQLAFQGALDDHFGQLAQQPALTGQLQPAGAGPLGELAQHLLISRRQLRSGLVPARSSHQSSGVSSVSGVTPLRLQSPRPQVGQRAMVPGLCTDSAYMVRMAVAAVAPASRAAAMSRRVAAWVV